MSRPRNSQCGRGAQRLAIAQSVASRHVRKLEDLLGVSLFERSATGVRVTCAGQCFCSRARAALEDINIAFEAAQHGGRGNNGHCRIGVIASLSQGALRKVIDDLLRDRPAVVLEILEDERNVLVYAMSVSEAAQPVVTVMLRFAG